MDNGKSRKASLGQLKKAVLAQRAKGTFAKQVNKVFRGLGINTKQYKEKTYEQQKELIGGISRALEEGGGGLRGFGERAKQRGVLVRIKGQKQEAGAQKKNQPAPGMMPKGAASAAKRIDLLDAPAADGPAISMFQNQGTSYIANTDKPTISAASLGSDAPQVSLGMTKK